jgi:asparagine synthase (glutamine-hydrolysing)
MCGCTSWTTARFALRKAMREYRDTPRWRRENDFLLPDAAPAAPEHHPWLEPPHGTLPGKREHVSALLRIQHFVDPDTRLSDLPFVHPLIAQPLVELCLQVPTWLWVRGGHNRAVARAAFRGLLPQEVLDRRSKGRLEGMCVRSYLRHRSDIADLLLGGLLREACLLDPSALETYLEHEGPPPDARYFRIFELVSAELWLRSWA